jgi:hypothetical protein
MSPASTAKVSSENQRIQFAFATTIKRSLDRVGLILEQTIFSHGQFYVALFRVSYMNLHLTVPNTREVRQEGRLMNVVFREMLL